MDAAPAGNGCGGPRGRRERARASTGVFGCQLFLTVSGREFVQIRSLGAPYRLDQVVLLKGSMQPGPHVHQAPRRDATRDDVSGIRIAVLPAEFLPTPPAREPFLEAALAAEREALPGADLASIWQSVLDRQLALCAEGDTTGHRYVVARVSRDPSISSGTLSRIETAVLVRVLWGEQQKLVAAELGIACSTASKWYTMALSKTRLAGSPIPLPLIIAAQAWASGKNAPVLARAAVFDHADGQYLVLSVPKPVVSSQGTLTPAECEVARYLVQGESRWEIAARRETSAQTVACQIRGIFSKWRLTGRYALIRRAVELGWFL
jgi:DNA-binding CsgD family transcriptional regulator